MFNFLKGILLRRQCGEGVRQVDREIDDYNRGGGGVCQIFQLNVMVVSREVGSGGCLVYFRIFKDRVGRMRDLRGVKVFCISIVLWRSYKIGICFFLLGSGSDLQFWFLVTGFRYGLVCGVVGLGLILMFYQFFFLIRFGMGMVLLNLRGWFILFFFSLL